MIEVACEFYAGFAAPAQLEHAEVLGFEQLPAGGDVIVREDHRYTVRRRWERGEPGQPEHLPTLEAVRLPPARGARS